MAESTVFQPPEHRPISFEDLQHPCINIDPNGQMLLIPGNTTAQSLPSSSSGLRTTTGFSHANSINTTNISMRNSFAPKFFRVNHLILSHVSPVFRTMISGAPGSLRLAIKYHGQEFWGALALILAVFHFRLDLVPTRLSLDALFEVMLACKEYDLKKALLPWWKTWVDALIKDGNAWRNVATGNIIKVNERELWLVVAYEIGSLEMFLEVAIGLMMECNTEGGKLNLWTHEKTFGLRPRRLTDLLTTTRSNIIANLIMEINTHLMAYRNSRVTILPKCSAKVERPAQNLCDSMMLGEMERGLAKAQLLSINAADPEKEGKIKSNLQQYSIIMVSDLLREFLSEAASSLDARGEMGKLHSDCGFIPQFSGMILRIVGEESKVLAETVGNEFKDRSLKFVLDTSSFMQGKWLQSHLGWLKDYIGPQDTASPIQNRLSTIQALNTLSSESQKVSAIAADTSSLSALRNNRNSFQGSQETSNWQTSLIDLRPLKRKASDERSFTIY